MTIIKKCEYCGKEMVFPCPSKVKRFCSHKCSNRWKWENVRKRGKILEFSCANCGKPVQRMASDWRFKGGFKLVFCSNGCYVEYSRKHRTPNTCEWCGKEFMHKYHNRRFCSNECKYMSQRLLSYRLHHDPSITKKDFIELYSKGNPFVFAGRNKEYYKEYVILHKEQISKKRKARLDSDPIAAYSLKIKKQIQQVYSRKQKTIKPRLLSILGCQAPEFIAHINSQLKDGMTVENYGKWQLDHIIPLSSAKTKEDVERLCHYTNYQPLWRGDNRRKGKKMPTEPI